MLSIDWNLITIKELFELENVSHIDGDKKTVEISVD